MLVLKTILAQKRVMVKAVSKLVVVMGCLIFCGACSTTSQTHVAIEPTPVVLPSIPERPQLSTDINWFKDSEGNYCVTAENARRLYLNIRLLRNYADDLNDFAVTVTNICGVRKNGDSHK